MITEIQMEHALHDNAVRLFLKFPYNSKVIDIVKSIPRAKWSHTKKVWHVPYHLNAPEQITELMKTKDIPITYINKNEEVPRPLHDNRKPIDALEVLPAETLDKLKAFQSWMRSKRYSENTIGTYTDALSTFLRYFKHKEMMVITNEDLIEFNNKYILANKLSSSYQNQVVNAVKLFFRTVEHKTLEIESIHRPKRAHVLPNVLSKEEIKLILNAHQNIKHRAMLSLIYSCGLRRSELLNLKLSDIDSKRGLILVKQAKGKKDRVVPLSDKILVLLRDYFMACKPKEWLFEGQNGSKNMMRIAWVQF